MQFQVKESTPNHEITVYDTQELYGERGDFRVLQFRDGAVQGAMDLNNPGRIVFEYPRAMIHLMENNDPTFESAFLLGHGIGTLAGHYPDKRWVTAELDQQVAEISTRWFGYRGDPVRIGDGRQLLTCEKDGSFDYIIVDAFTEQGTPSHLTTLEFFRLARDKLSSRGSILLNVLGRGDHDKRVDAIHTTLSSEFRYARSFYLPSKGLSFGRNLILMGSRKPITYQARQLAGFIEIQLEQGHLIADKK